MTKDPFLVHESVEQGSEEWFQIRKGRATASKASMVLTPTGRPSSSRVKYMRQLTAECLVDDPLEFMGNKFTDWGNEHEAEAREFFQARTGLTVKEVGFCTRPDKIIGCSPDGLILDESGQWAGGLEIKCPSRDKHVEYVMEGELPSEYKLQVHWSLAVTKLPYWYFVSYFPGLEPLILKVDADGFTSKVKLAQDDFIKEYSVIRPEVIAAITLKEEAVA